MNDPGSLLILGGGGHAAVVCESAERAGWTLAGYLDDDPDRPGPTVGARRLGGLDVLGVRLAEMPLVQVHAAIGGSRLRRKWLEGIDPRVAPAIVDPSASVSPTAVLGPGVYVGPRAVVNARARLERGAIVNSGAIVEHDCRLEVFSHVAPGAILGGGVHVGADALVGLGAVVMPHVRVGEAATVGAGAVATTEVPPGVRVVGVPARTPPAAQVGDGIGR